MSRLIVALSLGLALLVGAVAAPAWAAPKKDLARSITDGIICPCSCGEILTGCTCETAKAMRGYVDAQVKGGKTRDQIEASLVSQYGEVILGAPKAQGFNLLVWVAPVVATVAGLLIASLMLLRWRRRNVAAGPGGGFATDGPGGDFRTGGSGPADGPRGSYGSDPDAHAASLRARAEDELRRLQE